MMKIIPMDMDLKMRDKVQPGAFAGTVLLTNAILNTAMVYHGVAGCNILSTHLRSDLIPHGTYTPIVPTGVHEAEVVFGGGDKLEGLLRDVARGRTPAVRKVPDCVWVTISDATAIAADDIKGISRTVSEETGVKIIPIDAPGYKGGPARGAELALCAILDAVVEPYDGPKEGINIIGPFLMGSANWPFDIDWMLDMLAAADVKVNLVLSRNIKFADLQKFSRAEANYLLTYEDMPEFKERSNKLGVVTWEEDVVLPYGVANTEEWYLKIARRFGNLAKAKGRLKQEMNELQGVLRQNYNFSWMASLLSEKYAAVCGTAPFAAAISRYLYFDLNIRVKVVGLWGETEKGIQAATKLLEPIADQIDVVVMEDPTHYELGQQIKEADPDFVIGSIQDKSLFGGLGFPHLNLAGYYFYNNYNFIPWPCSGIRGNLRLFSEMCRLAQDSFWETEAWKKLAYQPREE